MAVMDDFKNIFTIDLEEWFVVEILSSRYQRKEWDDLPTTLEKSVQDLLDILHRHRVKATWFVLGWCADKFPNIIQEIFYQGHEIACHSYSHKRINRMNPAAFRADTQRAIEAIVRAVGIIPFGYRAPTWSINNQNSWAFEILSELGFLYDSSIYPIKHDLYGWEDGPRKKFQMEFSNGRKLYEIPATTYRFLGKNVPVGGGGYFRHSPYWYTKAIINRLNRNGQPVVFYIHPWEICSEIPRIDGLSMTEKYRTYSSINILKHKIEKLLTDFAFTNFADYLKLFEKNRIGF